MCDNSTDGVIDHVTIDGSMDAKSVGSQTCTCELTGEDLQQPLKQFLDIVSEVVKQNQGPCLSRIGEAIALQNKTIERIEEIRNLCSSDRRDHNSQSVAAKCSVLTQSSSHHGHRPSTFVTPSTCSNAPLGSQSNATDDEKNNTLPAKNAKKPMLNCKATKIAPSEADPVSIVPAISEDERDAAAPGQVQSEYKKDEDDHKSEKEAKSGKIGAIDQANSVHMALTTRMTKQSEDVRGPSSGKIRGAKFLNLHNKDLSGASLIERIVYHSLFDLASGGLILFSTIIVGLETNHMAIHAGKTTEAFEDVRSTLFVLFFLELLLRLAAQGKDFLIGTDMGWNIFDTLMVVSSTIEFCFQFLDTGGAASTGRVLRILRIVRITRAMRIGRILRYARTFRQIAYSLQSSMGTLFWVCVMMFLVIYCFAICFCQAATDHLLEAPAQQHDASYKTELILAFGSVPLSLLSLYKAMTGGQNWGEIFAPLQNVGWFHSALFVGFMSLIIFGVLNVVTAIFVDSALQSQQHYKDLLIQENLLRKQLYSNHLREVFCQIDKDGSGCVSGDEMEYFLSDPQLNLYLESIDIFPNDARGLFRLLDRDDSGEVSIDEFCEGCLRLKGEAKAFDIHCLIYNVEKLRARTEQVFDRLNIKDVEVLS